MDASGIMKYVAIVAGLLGVIALVVGIILLISAAVRKKDGKTSVTKVILGVFGIIASFGLFFVAFIFGILKLTVGDEMSSEEVKTFDKNIEKAFESNDSDELADLFAKKSVKGDPLTKDDAEEIFEHLGNDITNAKVRTNTFHVTNGDSFAGVIVRPDDGDDGDYKIQVEYIYKYWNEDCVGIQYIMVERDGKKVYEAGTIPYDED
ncbi:MAG: hypothetical protein K6F60_03040 [Eubacterium sp.]|nr:hypothetical protein [Eubacterium sp.]